MNWPALGPVICSTVTSWQRNWKTYNLWRMKCKKVHSRKENNTNPLFNKQWVKWGAFLGKVKEVKSKFKTAVSMQKRIQWLSEGSRWQCGFCDKVPLNVTLRYLRICVCMTFQRNSTGKGPGSSFRTGSWVLSCLSSSLHTEGHLFQGWYCAHPWLKQALTETRTFLQDGQLHASATCRSKTPGYTPK